MSQLILTADLHFGHANIIRYCNRPFADVHEMNRGLIERFNAVVKSKRDRVYILGDFAMKISDRETAEIFYALNGEKHLIIGNHDLDKRGNLIQATARLAWASEPTHLDEVRHDGHRIILSHYAGLTWNGAHRGTFQAFGHSHATLPGVPGSIDVGVDAQDYRPITADEFVAQAQASLKDRVRQTEKVVAELKSRARKDPANSRSRGGGKAKPSGDLEDDHEEGFDGTPALT